MSMEKVHLVALLAMILVGSSACAWAAIPPSERDVLISIYLATNGNQWTRNTNWCDGPCPLTGTPKFNRHGTECTWSGVNCYSDGRNVLSVHMEANQMTGTVPPLQGLSQLRLFVVPRNEIGGSVPDFAGMAVINDIDLSFNQLTGTVPDFSGMTSVSDVELSNNQLSGSIAPLTNLPQLQDFVVSNNHLTGSIPTFEGLYFLSFVAVDNNAFTGSLPDFSHLNVDMLYADHNQLTGPLPPPSDGFYRSARICPNPLSLAPGPYDAEWEVATGYAPWWGPPGGGCDHIFSDAFDQ